VPVGVDHLMTDRIQGHRHPQCPDVMRAVLDSNEVVVGAPLRRLFARGSAGERRLPFIVP
jgi:hypothetical protein